MADRLREYRAKRDLSATPEPGGARFVVQEHHARRLHWDLRLEHEGVAASWAVPKGIPLRPEDDRLAVHTEDHPLEYLTWEGDIPGGNYGAGTMRVWDSGTFETHKWREDEVMVTFHGGRVRGRYVLFRTRGDQWMLHRMDPPEDPAAEPLPAEVKPMLARLGTLPADPAGWVAEVKWDGVRALVWVEGGRVRLESRNGLDITSRYPELGALGPVLGARPALLDGEVVAFDAEGRPSFERLQTRMHVGSDAAVRRRLRDTPVTLVLFDLLHLDGRSLMGSPWEERRGALEGLGLDGPAWRTPAAQRSDLPAFLAATREQGLEGIVVKRASSPYEPGRRSSSWLKVKNVARQEVVVGGWLAGEGRRRETIGALLAGVHEADGRLRYAGRVGTGFTEAELRRLEGLLAPLEREDSPFAAGRKPPKGARWVEPELVAEVEFREWTSAGMIRHPAYKGLREDKPAAEVVREGEEPEEEGSVPATPEGSGPAGDVPARRVSTPAGAGAEVELEGRRLRLSNLPKVLYPETGFTKAEVLDYYIRIAPGLLPHLGGRPLTLKRYPNGVAEKFFYEKNSPSHRPGWVRTERIGEVRYTVCDDLPTLVWVANLASLELHTSLSRAADTAHPTMLVFDLDPGAPADILECCEVALRLRELFDTLSLECFPKTSGSKGLQIYVPLNGGGAGYAQTKPFAKAVAELLERAHPELVVSRMSKALRPGKVLVDWSQNDRAKTTVCVYSLRARPEPTVSAPVTWDEVTAAHDAGDAALLSFRAGEVLERFAADGDLFAPVLALEQGLPALGG